MNCSKLTIKISFYCITLSFLLWCYFVILLCFVIILLLCLFCYCYVTLSFVLLCFVISTLWGYVPGAKELYEVNTKTIFWSSDVWSGFYKQPWLSTINILVNCRNIMHFLWQFKCYIKQLWTVMQLNGIT